jgi:hypothetical protein
MFVDSYQVEVQRFVDQRWVADRCFCPEYKSGFKWMCAARRFLYGLLRRAQQEIEGSPHVLALIAKTDAHRRARHVFSVRFPGQPLRSVRITRTGREGSQLVKFVVWCNGSWLE